MLCSWKFIALLFWVVVLLGLVLGWFFFGVLSCSVPGEVLSGVDFLTRFGIDLSI